MLLEFALKEQMSESEAEFENNWKGSSSDTWEVDFVIKRGRSIWAIEVKSGSGRSKKGLDAFKNKFPKVNLVIIDQNNYFDFENDPMAFLESKINVVD